MYFLLLAAMEFQPNVITLQPQVNVTQYNASAGSSEWNTSVCDCCEDCGICTCLHGFLWEHDKAYQQCNMNRNMIMHLSPPGLCGTFIPCILACKVAQDSDESCCLPCLPGAMIALRTSIRHRHNIGVRVLKTSNQLLEHETIIPIMMKIQCCFIS